MASKSTEQGGTVSGDLLRKIALKFILCASENDIGDTTRLMYLVEEAHWYYMDTTMALDATLPSLTLKQFAWQLFASVDPLRHLTMHVDAIFSDFSKHQTRVPRGGAIVLNALEDKCLMMRGYNSTTWGFPKGKVAMSESSLQCAIREVHEECGLDITSNVDPKSCIALKGGWSFYIARGVEEGAELTPMVQGEVGEIRWVPLADLIEQAKGAPVQAEWPLQKAAAQLLRKLEGALAVDVKQREAREGVDVAEQGGAMVEGEGEGERQIQAWRWFELEHGELDACLPLA